MTRLAATATTRKSTSVDTQNQKLRIPVSPDRRLPAQDRPDPAGIPGPADPILSWPGGI